MKSRGSALIVVATLVLFAAAGWAQTPTPPTQPKTANTAAKDSSATAASNTDGRALLAKVVDALGGAAKLQSVHSIRLNSVVDAKTDQGEFTVDMEQLAAFPDRSWQKLGTPMGELTVVTTPAAGFIVTPQGTQELSDGQKQDAMREL